MGYKIVPIQDRRRIELFYAGHLCITFPLPEGTEWDAWQAELKKQIAAWLHGQGPVPVPAQFSGADRDLFLQGYEAASGGAAYSHFGKGPYRAGALAAAMVLARQTRTRKHPSA